MATKTDNGSVERNRPQFGERCKIAATMHKSHSREGSSNPWGWRGLTNWLRTEEKLTGIYIGYRNVAEGVSSWDGDPYAGGNIVFDATNRLSVWLFAVSEKRNPVYVLPEDVIEIGLQTP